jgi:hypothetical protein
MQDRPPIQQKSQDLPMRRIIAVDFDGTLCKSKWPSIGRPKWWWIWKAKRNKRRGAILILWTCREGSLLDAAVKWCAGHGLTFDFVNENVPAMNAFYGNDSRKIGAHEYWDDRARRAW